MIVDVSYFEHGPVHGPDIALHRLDLIDEAEPIILFRCLQLVISVPKLSVLFRDFLDLRRRTTIFKNSIQIKSLSVNRSADGRQLWLEIGIFLLL